MESGIQTPIPKNQITQHKNLITPTDPQNQMQFSVILKTPFFWGEENADSNPFARDSASIF